MKPELMYIEELNPESKDYRIHVKVVAIGHRHVPLTDGTLYQTLLLADAKGTLIHGRLSENEIQTIGPEISISGHYEISNAHVEAMAKHLEIAVTKIPYELTFGAPALIHRICPATGDSEPDFAEISTIATAHFLDEICELKPAATFTEDICDDYTYDVLGVVLFVEEEAWLVDSFYGQQDHVREVVITDQTNTQPIIINLWNHLAGSACDTLNVWAEKFIVVGFTSVKPSTLQGFSLSTGMCTKIIYNPEGDRANVLREWVRLYKQLLLDRQDRILQVRYPQQNHGTNTIQYLKENKAQNALQNERHWIPATIQSATMDKLTVYLGCLQCGKPTHYPERRHFACRKCYTRQTVSCFRVAFTFDVVDSTDSITLTALNNETEKIFEMKADQLRAMKENQDLMSFTIQEMKITSKLLHFKVGPTLALTASNTLKWSLEAVVVRAINDNDTIISNKIPFPNWSMHKQRRSSMKKKQQELPSETNTDFNKISSPKQEDNIPAPDTTKEGEEHSQETGRSCAPIPHQEI